MSSLVDRYAELIMGKYGIYNPTIIVYGSNCYGENESDLDVCIFVENQFDNLSELINDTIQFSRSEGIKVDEEVPYENKLIYTYEQVEQILMDSIFINDNGEYQIDDIVKSREFLSSEQMRRRLLINILTTEHRVLYGDTHFVKACEERAWIIILNAIINTYNLQMPVTDSEVLQLMYSNPYTGSHGEWYLGYKQNNERKQIYLENKLHYYLNLYKNKIIKLDSNVNPYLPTPSMISSTSEFYKYMVDYPENKDVWLRKVIASEYGLSEDYIMVTNGAMEAIHILISSFVDDIVAVIEPTFWGYGDRLRKLGKPFCSIMIDENDYPLNLELLCEKFKYIMICNPNNPTLTEIDNDQLEILLGKYPQCTFIIDETLLVFNEKYKSNTAINLMRKYNNLIVVMSLSKISGMCGLRCGFISSNPYNLSRLITKRALYNTNSICQRYFEKYFPIIINCSIQRERIKNNFNEFISKLNKRYIAEIKCTGVVFILVRFKDEVDLKSLEYELDEEGIKIQFIYKSYPMMKGNWIRISAGRREDLLKLATIINKFMEKVV